MENTLQKIRKRLSLVASWYWTVLAKFTGNNMKNLRSGMSIVASWYRAVLMILMGEKMKNADKKSVICSMTVLSRIGDFHGRYWEKMRWRVLFVASWYWAIRMNSMGDNMKNVDKTCYLWHHGTEPFWWFSWEIPQKNEITRRIRSVLVPSRFCDIDGKYHETNRQCVLFVASWYWAVLVNCLENIMKQNWDRACHL